MNLTEVSERVRADDAGKWDVLLAKDEMRMQEGRLRFPRLYRADHPKGLELTRWATSQLCQRLSVPTAYFRRCPSYLQDVQVNHWLCQDDPSAKRDAPPEKWLLRTKKDTLRGVLTERYAKLNNADVMTAVASVLEQRFEVGWFAVTDEAFHLRVTDPSLSREVLPGDRVMAGLHIANSEVGKRSVTVDALVYRLVCANGLIRLVKGKSLFHRRHVALSTSEFELTLRSSVQAALMEGAGFMERMRQATTEPLGDVEQALAGLSGQWNLSEKLADAVRAALLRERWGQQETLYGLVNAFTETAQQLAPDDRYTLETIAGGLLERGLPRGEVVPRAKASLFSESVLTLPFEEPLPARAA